MIATNGKGRLFTIFVASTLCGLRYDKVEATGRQWKFFLQVWQTGRAKSDSVSQHFHFFSRHWLSVRPLPEGQVKSVGRG